MEPAPYKHFPSDFDAVSAIIRVQLDARVVDTYTTYTVEEMEQHPDLLQSFWDLASVEPATRVQAAKVLLQYTHDVQKSLAQDQKKDSRKAILEGEQLAADAEYTFHRLIRGLCSGRDSARQGFSKALTEFLIQFPRVQTTTVMEKLREETEISSRMKGDEQRDALFGRLFGYMAIQRSGRLQHQAESDGGENAKLAADITKDLLEMAHTKSWIKEVCHEVIAAIVQTMPVSVLEKHFGFLLETLAEKDVNNFSPEELIVAISIERTFRDAAVQTGYTGTILSKIEKVFSPGSITDLCGPLLRSTHTFPRLHCVWRRILHRFVVTQALNSSPVVDEEADFDSDSVMLFNMFWNKCVDEVFLTGAASHEKKATGLGLFGLIVRRAPADAIMNMLSQNLLKVLAVNAASKKNLLHQAATKSLRALTDTIKNRSNSEFSHKVLAVLRARGYHHFDQKAKSTVVSTLRKNLQEGHLKENIEQLLSEFESPTETSGNHENDTENNDEEGPSSTAEYRRRLSVEGILGTIKDTNVRKHKDVIKKALTFLAVHSFCDASELDKGQQWKYAPSHSFRLDEAISDETQSYVRDKLSAAVVDATNSAVSLRMSETGSKDGGSGDVISKSAQEFLDWLDVPHSVWKSSYKKKKEALRTELTKEQYSSRESALEAVNALKAGAETLSGCSADSEEVRAAYEKATGSATSADLPHAQSKLTTSQSVDDDELIGGVSLTEHRRRLLGMATILSATSYWQLISPEEATPLLDDFLTSMKALCTNSLLIASYIESKKKDNDGASYHGLPVSQWQEEGVEGGRNMAMMVLLDGYLSLLSFGSTFLREAVKISARGIATLLTSGAVDSIVSVVHEKLPEEEGENSNTATSQEGHEENEDDGSSEGSESDDNDSGEERSQDNEEEEEDDKSTEAGSESEDEEAKMDKYDEMLAQMVKLRKAARVHKKSTHEKAKHFKFRTLDLIDTFATRLSGHPALLLLVLPLLRCYRMLTSRKKISGESATQGLSQQIFAILSKICNKSKVPCVSIVGKSQFKRSILERPLELKEDEETEDSESAKTSLTTSAAHYGIAEAIFMAGSSPNAEFLSVAGGSAWLLLRALRRTLEVHLQNEDAKARVPARYILNLSFLGSVYGDALTSFLTHKGSRMSPKLFVPVFRHFPALGWSLTNPLAYGIQASNSAFRRGEAFNLLLILAKSPLPDRNHPLLKIKNKKGMYTNKIEINEDVVGKRHDTVFVEQGVLAAYDSKRCLEISLSDAASTVLEAATRILQECVDRVSSNGGSTAGSKFLNASRQREIISFVRATAKRVQEDSDAWCVNPFEQSGSLVKVLEQLAEKTPSPPVKQLCQVTTTEIGKVHIPEDTNGSSTKQYLNGSTNEPTSATNGANSETSKNPSQTPSTKRRPSESLNGNTPHTLPKSKKQKKNVKN